MIVVVIVLAIITLASLGAVAWLLLRTLDHPRPGPGVAAVLDAAPPPPELSSSATRQIISIEILNPIELAGSRGRLAGIAGMLAPGITKRVVHDQAVKMVRRVLLEENVVADVRLHAIRPSSAPRPSVRRPKASPPPAVGDRLAPPRDAAAPDDELS